MMIGGLKTWAAAIPLVLATPLLGQAAAPPMPPAAMFPVPTGRAALTEGEIMLRRAADQQALPDLPGTGPYVASYAEAADAPFTIYAPVDLAAAAKARRLPIYLFGNGGCSYDGAAQRFHLTDMASYGYLAIVPGRILSGPKAPSKPPAPPGAPKFDFSGPRQTPESMKAALDWIVAENARPGSPYFGKLDTSRIAVAGGSCGGMLAMIASFDPRVRSLTMFNSGIMAERAAMRMPDGRPLLPPLTKADLGRVHVPVLYVEGGEEDLSQANALDDFARLRGVPVFLADRPHTGHIGMAWDPAAEGSKIEYHWLEYTLFGDARAGLMFTGADCSLCRDLVWTVRRKNL